MSQHQDSISREVMNSIGFLTEGDVHMSQTEHNRTVRFGPFCSNNNRFFKGNIGFAKPQTYS